MARLRAARALHPFPSLLLATLTVALVPIAGGGIGTAVVLGLGMLCYQFAIGLTNDVVDAEDDAVRKPTKPIPSGALSRAAAARLGAAFALAGLLITLPLPLGAWLIGIAGLSCGLAYDAWLKRTPLSWVPLALALPLVPVWVFVASDAWTATMWWAFPLGAGLGLALHLANQAPDVRGSEDAASGLPGWLGERASRAFAVVLFAVAASVTVAVIALADLLLAALAAALTVATGLATARLSPLGGTVLFGVLAVAGAVLAVLFVLAAAP